MFPSTTGYSQGHKFRDLQVTLPRRYSAYAVSAWYTIYVFLVAFHQQLVEGDSEHARGYGCHQMHRVEGAELYDGKIKGNLENAANAKWPKDNAAQE
jgi:hypothetical protein